MRKILLAGAVVAGLLAAAGTASAQAPMTADQLIAKHLEARGGLDKLRAIKTLHFSGDMLVDFGGGNVKLVIDQTMARGDKVRQDATIQGLTIVQAYDGAQGWQIQPFQGRKDAEALAPDDSKELADEGDIDGALVDYKAKGETVEYLGAEDMDGTPAYKLRVTEKSGDQLTYYIDTDSLMVIRVVTKRSLHGHDQLSQTDLGDYEQVAGVYFPFQIEQSQPGSTQKTTLSYTKGVANVSADDALFAMPKTPAK
jgi:outer membrane lipoprotein-sorting protein